MSSCEECCEVFGWPEGHYTMDSGKSIRVSCPCDCHSETKKGEKVFEIQVLDEHGQWVNNLVSDYTEDNSFATMSDATTAMQALLTDGDPRDSDVRYRVVLTPYPVRESLNEGGDMAQHTLGPWITGTQGGDGRVVYVGADMMFVPGSGPTTKANARLIARAPQLLAIVEFLGEWVKAGADNISLSALFGEEDGTLADAVWDALKKED